MLAVKQRLWRPCSSICVGIEVFFCLARLMQQEIQGFAVAIFLSPSFCPPNIIDNMEFCRLFNFCQRPSVPFEQRLLAFGCIQQSHCMLQKHFLIQKDCRFVLSLFMHISSTSTVRVFSGKMHCQMWITFESHFAVPTGALALHSPDTKNYSYSGLEIAWNRNKQKNKVLLSLIMS